MPNKIAFKGFRPGSQVTIGGMTVANWGGTTGPIGPPVTVGSTPWDLPASTGTGVKINVRRSPFQLAPEGVEFDLTLTGFDTNTPGTLQSYHASYGDKIVWWDYGDAYDFTAPDQVIAWDAADGGDRQNSRYSRGPLGVHVFRSAGTYTVRVFVYELSSGKIGQASVTFTVGNPDTYYSGTKTIYVASDSDYSGKPTGARETNSLDTALGWAKGESTPNRIMLKRGLSYTSGNFNSATNSYGNEISLRVEAQQGAGAQPIVSPDGVGSATDWFYDNPRRSNPSAIKSEVCFFDIGWRGTWDPTTVSGTDPDFFATNGSNDGSEYVLMDKCNISGFRSTISLIRNGGDATDCVFIMNDSTITDWRQIGIYVSAQRRLNVVGSKIAQNVDAVQFQLAGLSLPAMRPESCSRLCLIQSDFFTCCGHSPYQGSMTAIQPALRLFSSPSYLYAQLAMWGNVVESGRFALYIKPFSGNDGRIPLNAVVEGNYMIAGFQAECVMQCAHPATIRDNQFVLAGLADASPYGGKDQALEGIIELIGGMAGTYETENSTRPLNIYNNTAVNLKTKSLPFVADQIGLNDTAANNILHQPELGSPSIPYTNMSTAQTVTPRYKGYREDSSTLTAELATQSEAGQALVPGAASNARGAATGSLISPLDRFPDLSSDAIIDSKARDVGWAQYRS